MNLFLTLIISLFFMNIILLGSKLFHVHNNEVLYDKYDENRFRKLEKFVVSLLQKNNAFDNLFKVEKDFVAKEDSCKYNSNTRKKDLKNIYTLNDKINFNVLIVKDDKKLNLKNRKKKYFKSTTNATLNERRILVNDLEIDLDLIYDALKTRKNESSAIVYIKNMLTEEARLYDHLDLSKNFSCEVKKAFYYKNFENIDLPDNLIIKIYNGTRNPVNVLCDSRICLSLEWEFNKLHRSNNNYSFKEYPENIYMISNEFKDQVLMSFDQKYRGCNSENKFDSIYVKNHLIIKRIATFFHNMDIFLVKNQSYKVFGFGMFKFCDNINFLTQNYSELLGFPNMRLINDMNLDIFEKIGKGFYNLFLDSCLKIDPNLFPDKEGGYLNFCNEISMRKTMKILNNLPEFYNFLPNEEFYTECFQEENSNNSFFFNNPRTYDPVKVDEFKNFSDYYTIKRVISPLRINLVNLGYDKNKDTEIKEAEYLVKICAYN